MASYRYRAQIPAEELGAEINTEDADVLIFSKPMIEDVELARKNKDKKIVVDFCDDHFHRFPHYMEMAKIADLITCPSKGMQQVIKVQGFDSVIINDPYEYLGEPHANGTNMLWFGHTSNISEAVSLLTSGIPCRVVTGETNVLDGYTPWSIENLGRELTNANLVLIPNGKSTRSNNRMINAISAGCFVIAGDQHKDCRRFIWANKSIHAGIQFAKCFQDELNDMVAEGKRWVEENHSPKVIGKQWKQALSL